VTGKRHEYQVVATWTGNLGEGTARYAAYSRDHDVSGEAKPTIPGTADPALGGDLTRWNPEELFVASLSQCHMLEFLARAARADVVVTRYVDEPSGVMIAFCGAFTLTFGSGPLGWLLHVRRQATLR
jgi:organic hydroperoxide reductase OsmC/OhrA